MAERRSIISKQHLREGRPQTNLESHVLDYSLLKWSGLFVLICLLLAARFPDPLIRPNTFSFEQGSLYFQDSYNLPFWRAVFTPYAGYLSIGTRLLAGACVWLPYRMLPFMYSFLSLMGAAAVSSFFYLPVFRGVVSRDCQRFIICLGLCAASCAHPFLRLEGLHFYLVVFLSLTAVMDLPVRWLAKAAVVLVVCLSVWSAPSAIVLAPFFLYRIVRKGTSKTDRAAWALIVMAFAGYIVSVLLLNKPGIPIDFADIPRVYLHGFAYRVAAAGLAGEKVADRLVSAFGWNGVLPFLFLAGVFGWMGLRMARRRGYSLFPEFTFLWVISSTVLLIALRPNIAADFVSFKPGFGYWFHDRYFFPATVVLLLYLGVLWSRLRGKAMILVNVLGACWLCYLYLWGYTFHSWSDWGPKFAGYGKLIESTEREAAVDGKIHKLLIPIAPSLWFAVLDVGKHKEELTRQEIVPSKAKFTDFFDLDYDAPDRSGWRRSKWFGTFNDSRYPWVYNKMYGWMACLEFPSMGGVWFWSEEQGSFLVHPSFFPSVCSSKKGACLALPPQISP